MRWIVPACCVLFATQTVVVPQEKLSPQEAFFLRRITEFWKDHDYAIVKKQINDFLASNDASNIHNNLYALMGDILYQEKDYVGALATYNKIVDPILMKKVAIRRSQCLYINGEYDEVIQALMAALQEEHVSELEEVQFILADSLFRKMHQTADAAVQKELALQAKPLLLALFNTTYQEKVLLPLAEVHRELKEPREAWSLYLMLADKTPLRQEDLLLQAAALQLEVEPLAAVKTFQRVVDLGGNKAQEAAYQELVLLFQNGAFEEIISRSSKIELHLTSEQQSLFEFCLAHSYFKLEQLAPAVQHLTRFTEIEAESTPRKRTAYLALVQCAQKTNDNGLFDQVMAKLLKDFPMDEETGKALLLHAQTAIQQGDWARASHDLNQLVQDFPNMPDLETILYDQALLLSKTEQWHASRSAFISYLGRFPSTPRSNLIWASIVHASVQELKAADEEHISFKKEQLVTDLTQALTFAHIFSVEEEAAYQFLLGQLMFDLGHYSEALCELDRFCKKYPHHSSIAEAYFLQALSHQELKSDPEHAIPAIENALAKAESATQKTALRLQLFNAYLSSKQYDKAADNLYQTFMLEGVAIQEENQLWLAGYYMTHDREKSIEVFKKVLLVDDACNVNFDPAQTYLETEVLKFANLLNLSDKEKVLKSLVSVQSRHQALPWKHHTHALLELAKTNIQQRKPDEALCNFEEVISKGIFAPSSVRGAAILEKNRVLLAQCPAAERNEDNEVVRSALSTFKDLQIQKQLLNEPIHLEAALDYVDLRIAISPTFSRVESALFFLNRVKQDFNAKDDPMGVEYHEARLRYPEKDRLFQNHMKCIEAEIFAWEAQAADQKGDVENAMRCKQSATLLLNELLQDAEVTPYLKHRAGERLSQL